MIQSLNHINLAVTNLEVSFPFYREVLGFQPLCRWPQGAYFLAGDLWFCLFQDPKKASCIPEEYTHIAFSISQENFTAFTQKIKKAGIQLWKDNISEGDSLYFLDPDGYKLEVHVGNWQTRLDHKKKNPWPQAEFFI